MTETKVRFNPGHAYELRQIGILADDESNIEPKELIKRSLEKKGAVIKVLQNLQAEVGNKSQTIIDLDLWVELSKEDADLIKSKGATPERLEKFQGSLTRMGMAIYWATVQIPLIEVCSISLFNLAISKDLIPESSLKKTRKMVDETQDLRRRTGEIMKDKGENYIKAFEEGRKELFANGGTLPDIFDSV